MEKEENILGTEKIGKLIRKFSIPCIISMLVNSLYNIVDQIFIGWGVGYLGNGATNVVFPLTVICMAFALMFGDGTSAYLSLKLGENKKEEAKKGVANGIIISIIASIILCAISLIFLPQLLNVFGCTDALREYALSYGYIIAMGIPFMMVGTVLNSVIRADGSPKYAMISMVSGAILNIALDPIFIFVLKMGVQGAAIATVISQIASFIINAMYIRKFKTIKLIKSDFVPKFSVIRRLSMLGISSFITQISIVLLISVENNLLGKYGATSRFGAEIPITVLGIVMKISQILNSIILGIAVGSQPIMGYNYGAGKIDRVKKTLKTVLGLSTIISLIAFVLFQTIPDKLIAIFGSGDELYIEFACIAFRIYLMLYVFGAIQMCAGIFFQAIGKSIKSAFISLSRQILFLIPSMIVLGQLFGIKGILYSGPFADGLAFVVAIVLLAIELRAIGKTKNKEEYESIQKQENIKLDKHVVVTIAREYGSGGRYIGKLIAEKLGIKLYDKEFVIQLAKATGLSQEFIENNEQKKTVVAAINSGYYAGLNNSDDLFLKESELIKETAEKESCVIIGRCADFVLKDREDVIKIFIYSDMDNKVKRAVKYYGLDKSKAEKEIKRVNKLRANHYKYYTEKKWDDHSNYDMCINSDAIGPEKAADLICQIINDFTTIQ